MSKKTPHPEPSAGGVRDPNAIRQQPQSGSPDSAGSLEGSTRTARLPHERDESSDTSVSGRSGTDPVRSEVRQAETDVERGLKDTDRRGTPNDIPTQERMNGTRSSTARS